LYPILFEIPIFGGIPIHTFGALLAAGFLLGMWRLDRYAQNLGIDRNRINDLMIWMVVGIIIGCRVLYFVVHPDEFSFGTFFAVWSGGLVFYGGFVAALVVGIWKVKQYKLPVMPLVDLTMICAFLGVFIGRWGCLMVGDDYGRVSPELPFPPAIHVPTAVNLHPKSLFPREHAGEYLYATQVYMSLNGLMLFGIGNWIVRRQKAWGLASSTLLVLYSITRSTIEHFRGDDKARGFAGSLSTSQWISIPIGILGVVGLWYFWKRRGDRPVYEVMAEEASAEQPGEVAEEA